MPNLLYPLEMPSGAHPMAWIFYGHGLPGELCDRLAGHVFDEVGARLDLDSPPDSWAIRFAVDWPLDPGNRIALTVGEPIDMTVPGGARAAVEIVGGALPPGVELDRTAGKLIGAPTKPGLYSVTVAIGPRVKYDPVGGPGGPDAAGKWIPIGAPRYVPPAAPAPQSLDELTPEELEALIVNARQAQQSKLIQRVEEGRA